MTHFRWRKIFDAIWDFLKFYCVLVNLIGQITQIQITGDTKKIKTMRYFVFFLNFDLAKRGDSALLQPPLPGGALGWKNENSFCSACGHHLHFSSPSWLSWSPGMYIFFGVSLLTLPFLPSIPNPDLGRGYTVGSPGTQPYIP